MAHKYVNRAWMTTATTGTGTVTLGSAYSGEYYTFAEAGMSNGDTAYYVILDGTDVEIGVGTYTSSGTTFSRDTVTSSRISGTAGTSKISLSGSATIFIGVLAAFYSRSREVLTAARTYYVRTDGSDSNDGLANTSGGAFLTLQKAADVVASLDRSIYLVTIQVGNGTYTAGMTWKGGVGSEPPLFLGNTTTPSNVIISTTSSDAISASSSIEVKGFKIVTTTSGNSLNSPAGGFIKFSKLEFGACAERHIRATAGYIQATGDYSITGGANAHVLANLGGVVEMSSLTVTITGTPAWVSSGFVLQQHGSVSMFSVTFSGAATGKRYDVTLNSVINSYGAGSASTYFPGNSNGTTATGGVQG